MSALDNSDVQRTSIATFIARVVAGGVPALLLLELVMRFYAFAPRELQPDLGYVVADGATTHWNREGNGTGHWGAHGIRASVDRKPHGKSTRLNSSHVSEARLAASF